MRASVLAALGASLVLAAVDARAEASQLEHCQRTLTRLVEQPLTTLNHYPDYLYQRLAEPLPVGDETQLALCEERLRAAVSENLKRQPDLINAECRRSDRLPRRYRELRSYFLGVPELACNAAWFRELSAEQWRTLQPILADLNRMEVQCYRALDALAQGGDLRRGQARSLYSAVRLSRTLFDTRWQSRVSSLPPVPTKVAAEREQTLAQCEATLARAMEEAGD